MTQKSFFWDGVKTGDANTWTPAGGYHASTEDYTSPLIDIMFRALWNGTENRGVLYGWANGLAISGVGSPLDIATGGAIVYGLFYENDAATTIVVPTPTNETRIDRIVVRRDWSAQTARIYRLAGIEGGTAPTLIQSPGTFYDIPLAQVSIDIAGTCVVTDEREYCAYSTAPTAGTLTSAHVMAEAITLPLRETRTCQMFVSAADMEPPYFSSAWFPRFGVQQPTSITDYNSSIGQTTGYSFSWDGYLPPGQRAAAYAYTYRQWLIATFRVPDNLAGTSLSAYAWWAPYVGTTASYTWYSTYQAWQPNGGVTYGGALTSVSISGTVVLNEITKSTIKPITGLSGGEIITYLLYLYGSGTDRPKALGLEIEYTGYAP